MTDFVLSLPTWAGIAVAMLLATVSGFLVYAITHRFISPGLRDDLKAATGSLLAVVGLLVGLMLSLAFSDVVGQVRTVQNAMVRERIAIKDTFDGLGSFDEPSARGLQQRVIDYTKSVVVDDWPALAEDRLGPRATALKRELAQGVLALDPSSPLQEKLWTSILSDVDAISDHRAIRLAGALADRPLYAAVVVFGFLVTMIYMGVHRPRRSLLAFMFLYTIFVGLVVYLIVSLSDPFAGGFVLEPNGYERLATQLETELP